MSWFDRLIIKFRNFPLNDESLSGVIGILEDLFEEYKEKDNFFSNSESSKSENLEASLQLIQLAEITKTNVDELIKEIRNDLKYKFFTYFFQKKENLELIKKLNNLIIKFNNKIKEQEQELVFLEQNKLPINKKNKTNNNNIVVTSKDYFNSFVFWGERVIKDIIVLEEINLNIIENKKNFLKKTQELQNDINEEIKEWYQKNKKLEMQGKKIFESLLKEDIMTKFILSFWAFRVKNNNHEYTIDVENRNLENDINESNEKFSFSFKLIDDVFNKYLQKIIDNEEKICIDVFQKFSDQKKNFEKEREELIKNKENITEKIKQLKKTIAEQKQEIIKCQTEREAKQKQIKDLKTRIKNIKNKINTYKEDQILNKDNLENQISIENDLDPKKAKKQYIRKLEKLIEEVEERIKKINGDLDNLQYLIKTDNTELDNNNDRLKKNEEKINNNQLLYKQNEHTMLSELQKIKEKWIAKIDKNQKEFIKFLKEKNKLEDRIFIECLDECWRVNEDKISSFNKQFTIKNNLKVMSDESEKIEEKFKDKFEVLKATFELEEKKIIESANKEIVDNFQKYLRKINQSEIKSIETQTEINTEVGETSWLEQKIDEQQKAIERLEFENKVHQNKIILIKETNEEEVEELKAKLKDIESSLGKKQEDTEKICEKLKNDLRSKIQPKKEKGIEIQLNEFEIKLTCINELLNIVSNKIPSSQSEDKNEQNWDEVYLDKVNGLDLQVKTKIPTITSNVTNFDNFRFIIHNKPLII